MSSYELDVEMDTISVILDIIDEMRESGNYHNPTLDELEDRLQ